MTLYFDGPNTSDDYFTISVPNLNPVSIYRLLLSSEYSHKLEPKSPEDLLPYKALDLSVRDTNDRYTTFEIAYNTNYIYIRDNFYNGIYNIKIGILEDILNGEYIYEGTAKLITKASQDSIRNIKKYESDDEGNSSYVFYSDKL